MPRTRVRFVQPLAKLLFRSGEITWEKATPENLSPQKIFGLGREGLGRQIGRDALTLEVGARTHTGVNITGRGGDVGDP